MRQKSSNINKRNIFIILIAICILSTILLFFTKNNYKNKILGNNMSNKNIEEIEEYILNISSYEAKIEVTVESNKNTNKYIIEQEYQKNKKSKQTIIEPSNIAGLETKYENGTLTITNSKLSLTTVYENYNYLVENCLWLDSFIQDYRESKNSNECKISEDNDIVTMETKTRNENNKYIYSKKLTIDKKTGKPTKLLVHDMNQKNLIYILYTEITLNG